MTNLSGQLGICGIIGHLSDNLDSYAVNINRFKSGMCKNSEIHITCPSGINIHIAYKHRWFRPTKLYGVFIELPHEDMYVLYPDAFARHELYQLFKLYVKINRKFEKTTNSRVNQPKIW